MSRSLSPRSDRRSRIAHRRPSLERLESRALLTTYNVTTTVDGAPGSLREAIALANANSGADTILLPPGTYNLSTDGASLDIDFLADLDITDNLTIEGTDRATTIVDAQSLHRVFQIHSGSTTLHGLTIRNGRVIEEGGGGILNSGTLTLSSVVLTGNTALGGSGGPSNTDGGGGLLTRGFEGLPGLTSIINSTVTGNVANGAGGGVACLEGELRVVESQITQNRSDYVGGGIAHRGRASFTLTDSLVDGNQGSSGGGLFVSDFGMQGLGAPSIQPMNIIGTTITSSSIRNNTATSQGGGAMIDIIGGAYDLSITNTAFERNTSDESGSGLYLSTTETRVAMTGCTIAENSGSRYEAGGIFVDLGEGTLSMTNSTISGNISEGRGAGLFQRTGSIFLGSVTITGNQSTAEEGGGISQASIMIPEAAITPMQLGGNSLELVNTIVAGNAASSGAPDIFGRVVSLGYNLFGNPAGFTIAGSSVGNQVGIDPLLGPLADNGGPTRTHALLPGSPAIDQGQLSEGVPMIDQRGVARPQGSGFDIGAFELVATPGDLTIALAPESDSGVSSADGITNDPTPSFRGFAGMGCVVRVYAQGPGQPTILLGETTSGAEGWAITPTTALPDGSYVVTATSEPGPNSNCEPGSVTLTSMLVVDTTGPRVAGATLDPAGGRAGVEFVDANGLAPLPLVTLSNYALARLHVGMRHQPMITEVMLVQAQPPNGLQSSSIMRPTGNRVMLTLNNGQKLGRGLFVLKVSNNVTDLAGNPLNGEFTGTFPSGNLMGGGNFGALFVSHGRRALPPSQVGAFAAMRSDERTPWIPIATHAMPVAAARPRVRVSLAQPRAPRFR